MLALIALYALGSPGKGPCVAPDDEATIALLRELDALPGPRAAAGTLQPPRRQACQSSGCLDVEASRPRLARR